MSSKVDICNKALGHLGVGTITSLDEDSEPAIRCNLVFDSLRDELLRAGRWGFARAIETLVAISAETVPGWDYLYIYPAKALKVWKVFSDSSSTDPESEEWLSVQSPTTFKNAIAANISPAYVHYSYRVEDPERFDAGFVAALSFRIAAEVAIALTASESKEKAMFQQYGFALSEGLRAAGDEKHVEPKKSSTFIDARG